MPPGRGGVLGLAAPILSNVPDGGVQVAAQPFGDAPAEFVSGFHQVSRVPSFVNRQNQDLRDFMIGQDWEIAIAERLQS